MASEDAMDASLLTGQVIGAHKDETAVYQKENRERFVAGSLDGYGIKVPKRDKPRSSQTPQKIHHES
ncbi:MAG: hypothetical protein PHS51_13280 [Gallionella sp.]|nr:hypothetical protein [Gallionella sp.]